MTDKPSTLVPKLRFPEFRDSAGWEYTPLGDAFKTITNGHANAQDHQGDGAYPLFDRSEVVKRSPTFLFDAEAVILPGEGMRFQPRYFNGKFNLHQRAYALMEPTLDPCFAFHALDRFKGALADSAVQSTVRSLRMPIIEKFAIPCPTSDDEQQKIADCFGSLDDLIASEERKLEALRKHKQGLVQQLFPWPGENVPKLRFPEFRDSAGWEYTPLGDAFKTITNGHANAQDHQGDGAYPLFDRSEVVKRSPTFLFDAEAVILPGEGMRFQPRYFNGKFNLHQRAYALMEPTLDPCFAFHALDRFKGALADSAVQSTVRSLRMPIIEKFAIPCPTSDDEQQKIADCFGSLDDLIASEERKLEALKQQKQGLLQQLFPGLETE